MEIRSVSTILSVTVTQKEGRERMVFYFKARPEAGEYTFFMGLDKYENEDLIKFGFPQDIWYLHISASFSNWRPIFKFHSFNFSLESFMEEFIG